MRTLLAALAVPAWLAAQATVAPSPETVGRARGQDSGEYNVVHSFETGYRFHSVGGNQTRYRSDVNFGNGIRLIGSSLLVNSKEGHGRWFDEIVLNTQGLGNDPYQFVSARMQHNKLYRYETQWRSADYVNPGLAGVAGGHYLDTVRTTQDHDFTLLPQSPFRFFFGYSRTEQSGAGLSSVQLFDVRGDEFPLFALIDRRQSEYRLGAEFRLKGYRIAIHRGWQRYEEAAPLSLDGDGVGASVDDFSTLRSFNRTEPYRGDTPYWRANLFHEHPGMSSISARFSYAGSRRDFALDETSAGTNRFAVAATRQVLVAGSGRRPLLDAAATFSLTPNDRVTLTEHIAFHRVTMDGDITYREINNSLQTVNNLRFQSLSIRSAVSMTEANLRATNWLGVFGGYHFSTRQVRTHEGFASALATDLQRASQRNRLHSGLFGIRVQPKGGFSLVLDSEIGRADRPFFPISDRNYHGLAARVRYKTRQVTLSASARSMYNTNSVALSTHSSRSRNYTADASWSPNSWFAIDAGYAKLHLDTLSGIAYFAQLELVQTDRSLYTSNLHSASLALRYAFKDRVSFYVGYSRVQDIGDGRATPGGATAGSQLEIFRAAQTFPLTYQSPLGRLSVRLHDKLRWNFGYQHYHYREEFPSRCWVSPIVGLSPASPSGERSACPVSGNYRAHTGFTSVIWSF